MTGVQIIPSTHRSQILSVIRRSLSYIDERLVDHGERVGFLAGEIADAAGLTVDRDRLLVLCLLHDIGAYKTEEIDNMVAFETGDVAAHAEYGYVFLRNTTMLGEDARAILYHHTPYDQLGGLDTARKEMAALIFLADRIDILLLTQGSVDGSQIAALSGSAFAPALVDAFLKAEKERSITARVLDGSYRKVIEKHIASIGFTQDEIDSFVRMLVYSIDFRSPITVTHTANTTTISKALAAMFHMPQEEQHAIALAAFLHDIGKIGIPYSILESPDRLSEQQMNRMRGHVVISEEILGGIVPDEVCLIAARHHEKLNGKGYPRGLSAAQLTLAQRIVAVADIFSALISRRSYKEPYPKEKTVAILTDMRNAGELCPRVVDMVLAHYDELIGMIGQADDPVVHLYETIRREYEALER